MLSVPVGTQRPKKREEHVGFARCRQGASVEWNTQHTLFGGCIGVDVNFDVPVVKGPGLASERICSKSVFSGAEPPVPVIVRLGKGTLTTNHNVSGSYHLALTVQGFVHPGYVWEAVDIRDGCKATKLERNCIVLRACEIFR
jgi:hypothetical protein